MLSSASESEDITPPAGSRTYQTQKQMLGPQYGRSRTDVSRHAVGSVSWGS